MTAPILVVGRAGQLASDLLATASEKRIALTAKGRPDLDLLAKDSLFRSIEAIRPKAVINAAAYTLVDKAESEPDLAFALNRDGPAHLAAACAGAGIPLIHISTDQVFDGTKEGGYREEDLTNPLCLYGRSKLEGEEAVLRNHDKALVVRVSWVFGPSGDNFVKKVIQWSEAKETLSIVSDQRGRPTFSPALASALLLLSSKMQEVDPPKGILHLAGSSVMTRVDQARAVMVGLAARDRPAARIEPILTKDFPTPATRPLNAELNVDLARQRHGIGLGAFQPDLDITLDRLFGPSTAQGMKTA